MKNRVGEVYKTNQGYNIEITEYLGANNCTIKFDCGLTLKNISYGNISKGIVSNPMHKSVFEVGCVGVGQSSRINDVKCYRVWNSMLSRCYSKLYSDKFSTYEGISVCLEWHNLQTFSEWFHKNYIEGFELDKDILIKGNKIYSPETCAFVPKEINYLFTKRQNCRGDYPIGVSIRRSGKFAAIFTKGKSQVYLGEYKTDKEAFESYKSAKEKYIKEVAEMWKGLINERVYKAMYNYKIDITD